MSVVYRDIRLNVTFTLQGTIVLDPLFGVETENNAIRFLITIASSYDSNLNPTYTDIVDILYPMYYKGNTTYRTTSYTLVYDPILQCYPFVLDKAYTQFNRISIQFRATAADGQNVIDISKTPVIFKDSLGASGYSGYSWTESGISGYSGYSGIDGSFVSSGYSGYSGYSGSDGNSGSDGESGYSGYSGYSGSDGTIGVNGDSGYSGYSGIDGQSGYSGYSGSAGSGGAGGVDVTTTASFTDDFYYLNSGMWTSIGSGSITVNFGEVYGGGYIEINPNSVLRLNGKPIIAPRSISTDNTKWTFKCGVWAVARGADGQVYKVGISDSNTVNQGGSENDYEFAMFRFAPSTSPYWLCTYGNSSGANSFTTSVAPTPGVFDNVMMDFDGTDITFSINGVVVHVTSGFQLDGYNPIYLSIYDNGGTQKRMLSIDYVDVTWNRA